MANAPLIPSITGSPILDSLIGRASAAIGGALAAVLIPWLAKHGLDGLNAQVASAAIGSVVLLGISTGWAFLMHNRSTAAVVNQAVEAAITSQIPQAVIDAAKPGQIEQATVIAKTAARQPNGLVP